MSGSINKREFTTMLKFGASSFASFVLDYSIYLVILKLSSPVFAAYIIARIISGLVNYSINRSIVFGKDRRRGDLVKYTMLWAVQLTLGALFSSILSGNAAADGRWIKIPIDGALFLVSFIVQREFVFTSKPLYNHMKVYE